MPISPAKSGIFRRILFVLLLVASIILITAATFRLQSYFFARKVQSVLSRMEQIQLDKTKQAEVLALIPELEPGSRYVISDQSGSRCPGDACYVLRIQNWPGGIVARLQARLSYRFQWLFEAIYWLGHRYLLFAANVEIRAGRVSRYEYSLGVECVKYPASDAVEVEVLGADRASFPGYFGFMRDYDEIGDFRIRVPSNKPTTMLFVAFTPDAKAEDVRSTFAVHLECIWNAQGCSATKQLLPLLWEQKMASGSQK
jgi:hypothetical protein